jgi:hypothetical protein
MWLRLVRRYGVGDTCYIRRTCGDVERRVWAGLTAAGAVDEAWRVSGDGQGAQQVGVQDEGWGVRASAQRPKRSNEQPELLNGWFVFGVDQPIGGFGYRRRHRVPAVITDNRFSKRVDGDCLGDDVEVTSGIQLDINKLEWFEPGPNFDVERRTPLTTARTLPCSRVSNVTMRSASASLCVRSTTASSR